MKGKIILEGITVDQLTSALGDYLSNTKYDPEIGFSKKRMMDELGVSRNTLNKRVEDGKIICLELGGEPRYFFPETYSKKSRALS